MLVENHVIPFGHSDMQVPVNYKILSFNTDTFQRPTLSVLTGVGALLNVKIYLTTLVKESIPEGYDYIGTALIKSNLHHAFVKSNTIQKGDVA